MDDDEVAALETKVGDLQKQLDVLDREHTKMLSKRNEVMLKHRAAKRDLAIVKHKETPKEAVNA